MKISYLAFSNECSPLDNQPFFDLGPSVLRHQRVAPLSIKRTGAAVAVVCGRHILVPASTSPCVHLQHLTWTEGRLLVNYPILSLDRDHLREE